MKVTPGSLPDALSLELQVLRDERGWLFESYNRRAFIEATGVEVDFVQDNHSRSARNVLRGLHYQVRQTQGKLVRVIVGEVFDVAVDLRRSSPHFGRWTAERLSADNPRMLWIPPGFAHGFLTLSEFAEVLYKSTDYYAPEHQRSILWNDPEIGIEWPLTGAPIVSARDAGGLPLGLAETFP